MLIISQAYIITMSGGQKMKKLLAVLTVLALSFALVACAAKEVTATGYGITHKSYVGAITLTVKDGKVLSGSVEEYYLPYNVAIVEVADPANVPTDVVVGDSHGVKYFAKYFSVNGTLFTATDNPTGLPAYEANGTTLLEWVADEANAKAYVEGIAAGTVYVADETGAKNAVYPTPATTADWTKTGTNYGGDRWNWAEQVVAFADSLVGTAVDATPVKGEDNFWVVGDVKTGATMVDFEEYYAVAKRAFANATAK